MLITGEVFQKSYENLCCVVLCEKDTTRKVERFVESNKRRYLRNIDSPPTTVVCGSTDLYMKVTVSSSSLLPRLTTTMAQTSYKPRLFPLRLQIYRTTTPTCATTATQVRENGAPARHPLNGLIFYNILYNTGSR
jgi:hypothetical protein